MFSNATMDGVAHRLSFGNSPAEIREFLLEQKLSEYNAWLCYKAAKYLLDHGFYGEPGNAPFDPFKGDP